MSIDHNVCAAARLFDQEQPIGPLEEEVLGAMATSSMTSTSSFLCSTKARTTSSSSAGMTSSNSSEAPKRS